MSNVIELEIEMVHVCEYCLNEVYSSRIDGLDMCRECGCVETHTKYITLKEYEEFHA